MLRRMNMRLPALGLALLLTTACASGEPPAAPDLTVHVGLSSVERGTDPVTKLVEPTRESVVRADGKLVRIGPAVLASSDYETAGVVSDGTGVEVVQVRLTREGRTAYTELTAKAACHPLGDPRRMLVFVHAGRVVSKAALDPSVNCDVGLQQGRLSFPSQEGDVPASVIANGE